MMESEKNPSLLLDGLYKRILQRMKDPKNIHIVMENDEAETKEISSPMQRLIEEEQEKRLMK